MFNPMVATRQLSLLSGGISLRAGNILVAFSAAKYLPPLVIVAPLLFGFNLACRFSATATTGRRGASDHRVTTTII